MLNKIICFFTGHSKIEKYITETDSVIYTKRCKRCKRPCGLPELKNIPPPPFSTIEEIERWNKYQKERFENIRNNN